MSKTSTVHQCRPMSENLTKRIRLAMALSFGKKVRKLVPSNDIGYINEQICSCNKLFFQQKCFLLLADTVMNFIT